MNFSQEFQREITACPFSVGTTLYLKWNTFRNDFELPMHLHPADQYQRVTIDRLQNVLYRLQRTSRYRSPLPSMCCPLLFLVLGIFGVMGTYLSMMISGSYKHIGGVFTAIFGVFFGGFLCVVGLFFLLIQYGVSKARRRVEDLHQAVEQAQHEFFGNSGVRLRLSPFSGYLMVDFTDPPTAGGYYAGPITNLHDVQQPALQGGLPPPMPYAGPREHAKQTGGMNYPTPHYGTAPPPLDELTF